MNSPRHIAVTPTPQSEISETNNKIKIFGSAGGAGFTQYWLEYGITETPDLWFPIGFPQTEPKYNTVLHEWGTSALDEGIYTLRLSVQSKNGKTIRNKTVIEIRHIGPRISDHEASIWLSENRYDSTIIWKTDVLTTGSVEFFNKEDKNKEDKRTLGRVSYSESVNRQHVVYLSELGLPSGEYLYRLKSQNRAGLIRIDDNEGQFYPISVSDEQIPSYYFKQTATAQHGLHAVIAPKDLNGNGKLELIGVETGTTSAHIYELDDDRKPTKISTLDQSISRLWATADTDGDGLIELLGNTSTNTEAFTFLLEQPAHGAFPAVRIWKANGIWGGTIADMDLDGKPEIYSRHDNTNSIWVYESNGNNSYVNIAILNNPTQGKNGIMTRFATGDFDADGQMEILAGDSDGELFIYESVGDDRYEQTWIGALGNSGPHLFAAGDLDGDAIPEFAVGAKVWTTELDLPRQHWLFTIFTSNGNDSYRVVWHQRIRQLRDGESGLTIADANNDGKNELCIAASPNFYIIQNDGKSYHPIWHHYATSTFNPIVADIDNDGSNALMFNSDSIFTVFESTQSTNGEVPTRPTQDPVTSTAPPQLISVVHSPPNQLLCTFDKQMDRTAAIASRYKLHREKKLSGSENHNTEYFAPKSAIFDRSQKRVVLTFTPEAFHADYEYKIEVLKLSDIYGTEIPADKRTLPVEFLTLSDQDMIVYPNPARGNQITFDRLTADSKVVIYDVAGNLVAYLDEPTENRCRKIWTLNGVSNGVYIYVIENIAGRKIGKVSVIR